MEIKKFQKELVEKLMETEGECRGVVLRTDAEFVLREKGREGLERVEKELKNLGFPLDYSKINSFGFYPVGLKVISLLAIKNVFNWDEKKIEEMGRVAPKSSFLIKLFIKYFFSLSQTVRQVPKMWQKHYTKGNLEVKELNEKEKRAILTLKNLDLHPIFCQYLRGYFASVLQLVVGSTVDSEEIKCSFRGNEYHEYLIKWK